MVTLSKLWNRGVGIKGPMGQVSSRVEEVRALAEISAWLGCV
jgi:hypothetical protein